jgi:hypothetical protein
VYIHNGFLAVNTFVTETTERINHNKIDTKSKQQPSRRKVEYDDEPAVNRITFDIGVRTKNYSVSSDRRDQHKRTVYTSDFQSQ